MYKILCIIIIIFKELSEIPINIPSALGLVPLIIDNQVQQKPIVLLIWIYHRHNNISQCFKGIISWNSLIKIAESGFVSNFFYLWSLVLFSNIFRTVNFESYWSKIWALLIFTFSPAEYLLCLILKFCILFDKYSTPFFSIYTVILILSINTGQLLNLFKKYHSFFENNWQVSNSEKWNWQWWWI